MDPLPTLYQICNVWQQQWTYNLRLRETWAIYPLLKRLAYCLWIYRFSTWHGFGRCSLGFSSQCPFMLKLNRLKKDFYCCSPGGCMGAKLCLPVTKCLVDILRKLHNPMISLPIVRKVSSYKALGSNWMRSISYSRCLCKHHSCSLLGRSSPDSHSCGTWTA